MAKVEIYDTALANKPGSCYFDLKGEIDRLQNEQNVEIKDIKPIMAYHDGLNVMVAIFYEEK